MKIIFFWDPTPCSLADRYQCFGGTFLNQTTHRHIPKGSKLHSHRRENIKSCIEK
jgi:hypothetical protein